MAYALTVEQADRVEAAMEDIESLLIREEPKVESSRLGWSWRARLLFVPALLVVGCMLVFMRHSSIGETLVDEQPEDLWLTPHWPKVPFSECHDGPLPRLWAPSNEGSALSIKILTYNLFWWKLYKIKGGGAGHLIANNSHPPFDFLGMQECEDPWRVLNETGLRDEYSAISWSAGSTGTHGIGMAYRHKDWKLLNHGEEDVTEDKPGLLYYGRRGVQWMRMEHHKSKKKVFFMNHHGPLPLNSGGVCGGHGTAHNLLKVISKNGKEGDVIILVGDFNADGGSLTVNELSSQLTHVMNGNAFGGVDNVFTNLKNDSHHVLARNNLGGGGSDHDALEMVIRVEGGFHHDTNYEFHDTVKSTPIYDVSSAEHCSLLCKNSDDCKSWTWERDWKQLMPRVHHNDAKRSANKSLNVSTEAYHVSGSQSPAVPVRVLKESNHSKVSSSKANNGVNEFSSHIAATEGITSHKVPRLPEYFPGWVNFGLAAFEERSKRCLLWDHAPTANYGKYVHKVGVVAGVAAAKFSKKSGVVAGVAPETFSKKSPEQKISLSCECECSWAKVPGACNESPDDGSCCWRQCCGVANDEKHIEVHLLK